VFTGESLLEVILSDHAYKYHNDNSPLSGAHVRGEHKVEVEVEVEVVWLDSPLFLLFLFFLFLMTIFYFLSLQCDVI
jgi:hypothetical protein